MVPRPGQILCIDNLGDLYAESGLTLQGSFSAGWLAGKPDYPQKLKVPEGYEKINDNSNSGHGSFFLFSFFLFSNAWPFSLFLSNVWPLSRKCCQMPKQFEEYREKQIGQELELS